MVFVHLGEDLVDTLLRRQPILIHAHHDHRADHFVDGLQHRIKGRNFFFFSEATLASIFTLSLRLTHLDDLQHLHACDLSISIQIVHVEGPVEFLLKAPPGGDGQSADELPEVDGSITILVKCAKGVLSKF